MKAQRLRGLAPIAPRAAKLLVLGSFPSVASLLGNQPWFRARATAGSPLRRSHRRPNGGDLQRLVVVGYGPDEAIVEVTAGGVQASMHLGGSGGGPPDAG